MAIATVQDTLATIHEQVGILPRLLILKGFFASSTPRPNASTPTYRPAPASTACLLARAFVAADTGVFPWARPFKETVEKSAPSTCWPKSRGVLQDRLLEVAYSTPSYAKLSLAT
jgi:hypothetical protein